MKYSLDIFCVQRWRRFSRAILLLGDGDGFLIIFNIHMEQSRIKQEASGGLLQLLLRDLPLLQCSVRVRWSTIE